MTPAGGELGRVLLILLLCALTVIRIWYRYRAGLRRVLLLPLHEGPFLVACRLVLGLPLAAATALSVFTPGAYPALVVPVPPLLRVTGGVGAAACLVFLWRVQRELGACFTTTVFLSPGHRLVTTGPYRRIRHPMYVAYLLFFLLLFPVSGNWVITLTGALMIVVLMTVRLRREESLLWERFGDAWVRYRSETGAFIPRLRPRAVSRDGEPRGAVDPGGPGDPAVGAQPSPCATADFGPPWGYETRAWTEGSMLRQRPGRCSVGTPSCASDVASAAAQFGIAGKRVTSHTS